MSLLWCRRKLGSSSSINDRGQQVYRTGYTAKSNKPRELRNVVLSSDLVPHYGAPHPENNAAVCTDVTAEQNKDNPYLWDIRAEWQTNPASRNDPADRQKPPDQRRPKWTCKFVEIPCFRFADLNGKPLRSTAGQPFDPVPDIPIIADEITIQRYEPVCNRGTQRDFMDKCNYTEWFGAAQGTAYMADISVQDEFIQGTYWFPTTYRILIKPRIQITLPLGKTQLIGGWDPEYICNLGTLAFKWNGTTVVVSPIIRTDPITQKPFYDGRPAYLSDAGVELARDVSTGIYTEDPVFLEFHLKAQVDFAPLNLTPPPGMTGG